MRFFPWKMFLTFFSGSMILAYPASLGFYTLYIVLGRQEFFPLSLLTYPVIFFLFALWFFKETRVEQTLQIHFFAAILWGVLAHVIATILYVPVYSRPLSEQFQNGPLLGVLVNIGAVLLAGFMTRGRVEDPLP